MSTAHVVPLHDLVAHQVPGVDLSVVTDARPWFVTESDDDTPDCVCNPTAELVRNDDGPDGWMWTHHSLDGRELTEKVGG